MKSINLNYPTEWDLAYWQSGEYQLIEERLNDVYRSSSQGKDDAQFNPDPRYVFAGLRSVLPERCRVAIIGQDPYPKHEHACGVAFSLPRRVRDFPPTLVNIFKELEDDLGYSPPKHGDLTRWCEQGVLLWNVYPTCATGKPGSHHWDEWTYLTKEIVEKLDGQVVFVLLGASARSFRHLIHKSPCIETSHPSPLGAKWGFLGSRIFSRTNASLVALGKEPIDWRLT